MKARIPALGAVKGMSVTLRNFFRRAVTVEYPEERRELPDRFRGRPYLDTEICVGCGICAEACPNGALEMVPWGTPTAPDGARETAIVTPRGAAVRHPRVNIAMCLYCGLCEEACPTGAIRHTQLFELAREDRGFGYPPNRLGTSESETETGGGEVS